MPPPPPRDALAPAAIVVMGVSGCGKSTVGAALAARLGCRFIEGDSLHDPAAVAKMSRGHPLSDADRWPWLDRVGHALAAAVAADGIGVAACSALRRDYRDRLQAAAAVPIRFVFLDDSPAELARRLAARPHHYMPASLLQSQLDTLERPGADEPAVTIDAGALPEAICDRAIAWLRAVPGASPIRPATS